MILAHETRGSGEPVLLLNGGMMSWGAWEAISAPLAERFQVVLCDLRGQLRTGGAVPARLEEHADDVDRLLGHLGIPAVHVLGTSFGAEVGLLLAALHPERVLTVTAVAATDLFTEAMYLVGAPVVEACLRVPVGGDRGLVFDAISAYAYSRRWLEANRETLALRRAAVSLLPDDWFAAVASLVGSLKGADLTPHLGAIRCPVHVVAAEEDGAMPLERTLALAAKVPGARHTVLPGAGHAVVAEDPGLVVRLFLADRDAGGTPVSPARSPGGSARA